MADSAVGSGSRRIGHFRWVLSTPRMLLTGAVILGVFVAALLAPWLAGDADLIRPGNQFLPPGGDGGLLGTDEFGRGIANRLIYGSRLTVIVSVGSVAIATVAGVITGVLAAYYRGWIETGLMRSIDLILAFPPILLAIFAVAFLGASLPNLIAVIAVLFIPRFARIAHSAALAAKEREYVEAAVASGFPHWRVMFETMLPNIIGLIWVHISLAMGQAILIETGLSFLGLGPPPPTPSWGRMIQQATRFMGLSPWGVLWPSIVISVTVIAFNILGDALRDRLDPSLRT